MTTPIPVSNDRVENFQYPMDLSSAPEYNNMRVLFFINNVSDSIISRGGAVPNTPISDSDPLFETGAGAGVDNKTKLTSTRKMVQLKSVVSLYVPTDMSFSTSANWNEDDLSTSPLEALDTILGSVNSAAAAWNASDKSLDAGLAALGSAGGSAVGATVGIAASIFLRGNTALQSKLKLTPGNAKAEQLFQSVDFRTFTFSYQFSPRSSKEAMNCLNIVRLFKYHMLPEFSDESQYLFKYPSQFEIKYYIGPEENKFLEKHYSAVLTNCTANYSPTGQFVTFKDGMPSHINMTLTFKELTLPTKNSYYKMYDMGADTNAA